MVGRDGNADSDAEARARTLDDNRLGDGRLYPRRQIGGLLDGGDARQHDRKFITADPGEERVLIQKARYPASELDQCGVARGVAVNIVDGLETVEVEHQNGETSVRAVTPKIFIELFLEEAAIRQGCQRIMPRQMVRLAFGSDARLVFTRDVPIATHPVGHYGCADNEDDEDQVVHLQLGIGQRELQQIGRQLQKMRGCVSG